MASSNPPPFMVVEDTDEDFFDKLVNDDHLLVDDSNPPASKEEEDSHFTHPLVKDFPNPILSVSSNSLNSNATLHLDKPPTAAVKEVQWTSFGADAAFFDEDFGNALLDDTGKGDDGFVSSQSNGVVNNTLHQFQSDQAYATTGEQAVDGQDPNASQYWENLYPGWRYDANTGQWYQVDESYNATLYQKSEFSYMHQSVVAGTTESVTSWDSVSQSNWNFGTEDNNNNNNKVYPPHMVFDPQYPGWYYDMNVQEWRSLDDYNSQAAAVGQDRVNQNGFGSSNTYYENDQKIYSGQEQDYNWNGSFSNTGQQGSTMWQPNTVSNNAPMENFRNNQQFGNHYDSNFQVDNHVNQQNFYDHVGTATAQVNNGFPGSQSTIPYSQSFNQSLEQSEKMNVQKAYGSQNQLSYLQQPVHSGHQGSYGSTKGRSSADRPLHALATFGFGGKLIVMKDATSSINASYGGQDSNSGSISVLNLAEVVTGRADVHDYFHNLCQQSFPGPLSAGNAGSKELNKWLDDRITHSQTSDVDYNKSVVLRLLLCLLKIASQHYGKLRSPLGSDTSLKENDAPEVAVARLFASVKRSAEYNYGAFAHCLQHIPSEVQIREAAAEVQTLLVSGRKQEALLRAQEGHLWGPALVLAAQLGDQFYVDTVKKMALGQLVPGSPLRTLCLLIAGQPADVFAADARIDGGVLGAVNVSQQQPTQGQHSVNGMLDDWEDNLAVIAANRTKDDELVLIHLGDCLWKERSNIIAAHICYLVAEANFEPYSDTARLCLLGADHWTHPRTYASPEAIQRTEVYEYSKMLGNSQFTLLPFQPYKLYYAHMLAEVGRLSDSLKYCQAVTKSLKTGRIPEVDIWRQLVISLEDRIKIHQQGGFSTGKIVGKLLNLFDTTAQRVVGGLPPPVPSTSGGSAQHDHYQQPQKGSRVLTSQSTMAMSSLVPSASMEPINQADGNNKNMMHNRSASEPAFVRSPTQDDTLKEKPTESQSKASEKISTRRGFGLAMLFEKTVGKILPSRQDKQAKLGEANKFYYDEKLKRWVEEGVDPPAEEATIAPPPTMAAFQNGSPDYSLKTALTTESTSPAPTSHTSGIPLIPPATNQFSARARTAPRARYVDTFNKGGGNQTNLFQSPSVPTINRPNPNPNFFVPTAAPAAPEQPADTQTPPLVSSTTGQSAMSIQKFASMNDMSKGGSSSSLSTSTSSITNHPISRRTSSWSGGAFMPNKTGFTHSSNEVLQEVEL
ncbi:protein transport protein SEC16B homolog [Bidens hawaiensis]|uniref:protein transport protein SEC16B homolog n=1 Tax=Bidens hawaiensis TaxID=980011 RepID=UPI00404940DC